MSWLTENRRKRADKHLAEGRTAKALHLYRKDKAWDAIVDVHRRQGDLKSAAEAAEEGGMFAGAAQFRESAREFSRAAELWLRVPNKERAALAYELDGNFEAATRLFLEAGMPARAAEALAALNRQAEAAKLYEDAQLPEDAIRMYRAAGLPAEAARLLESKGAFAEAALLRYDAGDKPAAAELYKKARQPQEAARCYAEIGDYPRAGETLEAAGYLAAAAQQYEKDPASLERSAQLYRRGLQSVSGWQRKFKTPLACLAVSALGRAIAVGTATRQAQLLQPDGTSAWHFRPSCGGRPTCIAVSDEGRVALGCDDKWLYVLEKDKKQPWSHEFPEAPVAVSMDASGERIVCCTRANVVYRLDKDGTVLWEHPVEGIVCDVALSADGLRLAVGTAEGLCILLTDKGERIAEHQASDWVDSVSLSADGALCAMGIGMNGVELLDVGKSTTLWSVQESAPVHNVLITPRSAILSVTDTSAWLRNVAGGVIWRYDAKTRLLNGCVDGAHGTAVFRCENHELLQVKLQGCVDHAAANYEKAGNLKEAGAMYESVKDHARAAEMFRAAGDLRSAARNVQIAGSALEAAKLYESAKDFEAAARLYEAEGKLENAAECYSRASQPAKAAELFEVANRPADAAALFERAQQHQRAGSLYRAAGNVPAAIRAYTEHLRLHPNEAAHRLELGGLLQQDGQYDAAIEHYQKAAQAETQRRAALMHLAECFVAKNLYDIAADRYQACLKPGEKVSWDTLEIHYGLARAHHLAGGYAQAKQIYEGILAIDYQYKDVKQRLDEVKDMVSAFAGASTVRPPSASGATIVVDSGFQTLSNATKERYAPKRQLGKGGMGTVFLAEDKKLKRDVALKILPPALAGDQSFKLRMLREAQVVAQLNHPNIVRVFDVGEENGRCFIIMEYVEGRTVRELLAQKWKAKPCADLLLQVTNGLADAHKKGITHRDIKPENIIIAAEGTAKLMDFGLALSQGAARLTAENGVCGTYCYMAPEQVRGERDLSPAVDVYAVGCMGYELLNGTPPFTGDDIGIQHLTIAPKPISEVQPETPAALAEVIMKCLSKKPADRYPDAGALHAALQKIEGTK